MDHSAHDHSAMAHRCQMSMLFTWNTKDLCLVFRWWHVSSTSSLIFSLLAVVALGMGYEYLREISRRYEARIEPSEPLPPAYTDDPEASSPLPPRAGIRTRRPRQHVTKALLYGAQVFYSFFIMLLFMTYNGWVMISVALGAVLGYMVWGGENSVAKSVACH